MAPNGQSYNPALVRWGAVIAGAVIGFGAMVLLSSLWVAIGENATTVSNNLHWYSFVSAVVALLIAGLVAGWLSGVRGVSPGLLHGLTVWGVVLVGSLAFPIPQALRLFDVFQTPLPEVGAGALWASFFGLLIGLAAAAIGGVLGGALSHPHSERSTETVHTVSAGPSQARMRQEEDTSSRSRAESVSNT